MFAGQRNKEQLLDLWWWDVGEGRCGALCAGAAACPPPAAGFTQRATIDPDTDEIFVLSVRTHACDTMFKLAVARDFVHAILR